MTALVLIATGLIKLVKNRGAIVLDPIFLQWIAFSHTVTGMIIMIQFVAHVAPLLLKNHRPLMPSLFSGKIDREQARKHHPEC